MRYVVVVACVLSGGVFAQGTAPPQAVPPLAAPEVRRDLPTPPLREGPDPGFAGIWATSIDLQTLALMLQLRDWCLNRSIPDEVLERQLGRLGALTGREEDCRTVLSR
ncbi:hypothetical protein [Tepidiphilus baoligensis]|uniref:Uncharacterized protein n=1 Tax=Tepidiphilus baoligensis TaxID=2698687 RepID=A0ABX1QMV3_9PROT|nr:hypothetical protein [Tepidiphilus baoligensis]NMH17255.1 hypothetical protein [Tepidiphilus baoligensis]